MIHDYIQENILEGKKINGKHKNRHRRDASHIAKRGGLGNNI